MTRLLALLLVFLMAQGVAAAAKSSVEVPTALLCEYRENPLNVDVLQPRLSWIFSSTQRGELQLAYQVVVASSLDLLNKDQADLWDTGKIQSDQSIQLPYAGKALASGQMCFWKVRLWNKTDQPTPWSQPASWSMGLLGSDDWKAKWIRVPTADSAIEAAEGEADSSTLGYHAATTDDPSDTKWVQVDLGRPYPIDAVKLHSLNHEVPGFGFPIRFTVTASDDPDFAVAATIADQSAKDYPNPGAVAITLKSKGIIRRYVRVTATRLFRRTQGEHTCCFALAELQVFSDGKNVALHAPVTALDSVEGYGWGKSELTDGIGLAPDATDSSDSHAIKTLPIFRRSFQVTKPVARAMIYLCGLGQYELHLNGEKVGDSILDPGWTDYRKTCLYQAHDVTSQLKPGSNVMGVMLGNGMYNVVAASGRYSKFTGSMGPLKLIAQLQLTYTDGSTQILCTDNSWKTTSGPITFSNTYGGEDYDARLEQPGWDKDPDAGSNWQPASETDGPGGKLTGTSQSAPPITVSAVLKATKITHPKPDVWVYDLGQNCAEMPCISVSGHAGDSVKMTPAEVLKPNGTVSQEPSGGPTWFTYTLKEGGVQTWSPRFTYYGSRYIQVSGAVPAGSPNPAHLPVITDLHGQFITSSSPIVGDFSCSNPMFNRTAEIIRWAMRSNLMSVVTDCPHREKLGWLEENHLVGPSLMYNFQIPVLFTKVCADTADAQTTDGLVPDIAPEFTVFSGGFRDSPEWGSACVLIPWQVYQWYGDTDILARRYDTMKRYVDYLGTKTTNNILSHGLGDWYDIGPNPPGYAQLTPIPLTATAFYYRDITILSQAAKLLEHDDDSTRYAELGTQVRDSFNAALYHPDQHSYATNSQTGNAIPLEFGLAPEADRTAIVENIVQDIRKRHNGLTAGDVGYRYLLRALADGGRSDVIFDMNSRSDKPGYGMIIAKGATSLTEAWDGRLSSSQDHFMLGHIMEWFYSDLAGIQLDPTGAGYKKIIIKPTPVGDVTWARASYNSVRGIIQSSWKIKAGTFYVDVVIPENCTATVMLPRQYNSVITQDQQPLEDANNIRISSGIYHFESHYR